MTTGASKVRVSRGEPKARAVPSAATSTAGAVGITQRGPVGRSVLVTSPDEYRRVFGGYVADSDLALAVDGFFGNGGTQMWIARTVHYLDVGDASTATARTSVAMLTADAGPQPAQIVSGLPGPYNLSSALGEVLVVSFGVESTLRVSVTATSHALAAGAGPWALTDGQSLTVRVDRGDPQVVVFRAQDFADVGAATAAELGAVFNAQLVGVRAVVGGDPGLALVTLSAGTGSLIEVTPGPAAAVLDFQPLSVGGGNVANANAVTAQEIADLVVLAEGTRLDADVLPSGQLRVRTLATGVGERLQVQPVTSAAFSFDTAEQRGADSGFANVVMVSGKTPGAYPVEVEVRPSTSGPAGTFDLLEFEDGRFRRVYAGLSLDPAGERPLETVVNDARGGSDLIQVSVLGLDGVTSLPPQSVSLTGGDDGLVDLADTDFIGSQAAANGLRALDTVQDLGLLLVPGVATPAVQQGMLQYCDVVRESEVFAVLDPPADHSATEIADYVDNVASLGGSTESAAIYWPRVQVANPARGVFGPEDRVVVAPSGIISGVFARTDAARPGGVYDSPAGTEEGRMFGVLGFETDEVLDIRKRDIVFPRRINPLTTESGEPRYIDGARTLKGDGQFPSVAASRGVMFIAKSLKRGLNFVRHKNHTERLRAQVRRTIDAFLLIQTKNGAFASRDPRKAFYTDVSEALNTPTVVAQARLRARIGLAMNDPAEFVDVELSKDTRALDAELAEVA